MKTYRLTGIFVLTLAAAVAAFGIGEAKTASADSPPSGKATAAQVVDPAPGNLVGQPSSARGGGWFPLPPQFIAFCNTFSEILECKPCGIECASPTSAFFLKNTNSPSSGHWIPVAKDFVFCQPEFSDFFECKCVGTVSCEIPALEPQGPRGLVAQGGSAKGILVKICGSTIDNGAPGCVLAILK